MDKLEFLVLLSGLVLIHEKEEINELEFLEKLELITRYRLQLVKGIEEMTQ